MSEIEYRIEETATGTFIVSGPIIAALMNLTKLFRLIRLLAGEESDKSGIMGIILAGTAT